MAIAAFFLNPQSVQSMIPAATFERAKQSYLLQQVLDDYDLTSSGSRTWDIAGLVQGTARNPYWVTVTVELNPVGALSSFGSECTCPAGRNCQHGVALMLKAAYQSAKPAAVSASAPAKATPITQRSGDLLQPSAPLKAMEPSSASPFVTASKSITPAPTEDPQARLALEQAKAADRVSQWMGELAQLRQGTKSAQDADISEPDKQVVFMLSPVSKADTPYLQMHFGQATPLRRGGWGKVNTDRHLDSFNTSATDLEIVQLVRGLNGADQIYSTEPSVLSGETGQLALHLSAKAGRLFTQATERNVGMPLRIGPPRAPHWTWREVRLKKLGETAWQLQAYMDGTATEEPSCFANTPPLYLDKSLGHVGLLEVAGMSATHIGMLLKAPPIPLSLLPQHETLLLSHMTGLPLPPSIRAPQAVHGESPKWQLQLDPIASSARHELGLVNARLRFGYRFDDTGLDFFALGTQNPCLVESPAKKGKSAQRINLYRDLDNEQRAMTHLQALGLVCDARGNFGLPLHCDQHQWLQWVDENFAVLRKAGFELTLADGLENWIAHADGLNVNLEPESVQASQDRDGHQNAWFSLSLGIEIQGQRLNILPSLRSLLTRISSYSVGDEAYAALPRFVYLPKPGEDGFIRLPAASLKPWIQALLDLARERPQELIAKRDTAELRLSRLDAIRFGAALGEGARWSGAENLQQLVEQLQGLQALPEVPMPAGLQATLRPYQHEGVNWLQFLRQHQLGGILADDMGLGKTLQTLTHLLIEKEQGRLNHPALIIAPVSLMGNWRREAQRFTPGLSVVVLHGADRHEAADTLSQHDVVIAPYSLLHRDRDRWVNQPWHIVVLDEAQNIKNASTHAAQVVAELDTRHRLCLSGTPMENHLGELWSLFHFLMPGFLGSQARFKEVFRTPIEKSGDNKRLDQLRHRVMPFMLRRHKSDVAKDLPPKVESISSVELQDEQADLYETIRLSTEMSVREALSSKGLAKSQIQILDALLKLRQVCCDPRLVSLDAARNVKQSAKLELLMDLLPEMLSEGRKVLLFSQFTSMLTLIEDELRARDIAWVKLTGQSQNRDALVDKFTSGQVPLFLISLKAGGVGLNLPQADTVIHYDPWWNPAVENQATDRAHRIGQTQQVMVYKLVVQGTIEERILALQERKSGLANSMYSGSASRKEALFTETDVAELLKPLGT